MTQQSTNSHVKSDAPVRSAFGFLSRLTGNDVMLYAGWLMLVIGLAGWFSWFVAAAVGGALLMTVGIMNAYFVTWLSTRVVPK